MTGFGTHWRHAAYLVRHKWFVLLAGLRLHVPLWRLVIHDWSKWSPAEWDVFTRYHAGLSVAPADYERALAHHHQWNPHHWQHWNGREMPEHFVREMVADWMGAQRAKAGDWNLAAWFATATMTLHPATRTRVEGLLSQVGGHGFTPISTRSPD